MMMDASYKIVRGMDVWDIVDARYQNVKYVRCYSENLANKILSFLSGESIVETPRICSQCAEKIKPITGFICEDCLSDDPEGRAMSDYHKPGSKKLDKRDV